jgi:hypothetical protein
LICDWSVDIIQYPFVWRPTSCGRGSRNSPECRGQPRAGDAVTTHPRPTPDKQHIFDFPKGILGDAPEGTQQRRPTLQGLRREMQSRLARGHPRVGDIVMTRLRSMPGGRRSHDSPETNPRRVMQSRLARGQPRARDPTTTRSRPTLGRRSSHNSPEAKPQVADAVTIRLRPTSSTWSCFMILIIFAT